MRPDETSLPFGHARWLGGMRRDDERFLPTSNRTAQRTLLPEVSNLVEALSRRAMHLFRLEVGEHVTPGHLNTSLNAQHRSDGLSTHRAAACGYPISSAERRN